MVSYNGVTVPSDEKYGARIQYATAIARGALVRPERCSRCRRKCKPEGHHTDYRRPLDVVWLCRRCHVEEHQAMRADGREVRDQPRPMRRKPVLKKPKPMNLFLEDSLRRRLEAYAASRGLDLSKAARELLAVALTTKKAEG